MNYNSAINDADSAVDDSVEIASIYSCKTRVFLYIPHPHWHHPHHQFTLMAPLQHLTPVFPCILILICTSISRSDPLPVPVKGLYVLRPPVRERTIHPSETDRHQKRDPDREDSHHASERTLHPHRCVDDTVDYSVLSVFWSWLNGIMNHANTASSQMSFLCIVRYNNVWF